MAKSWRCRCGCNVVEEDLCAVYYARFDPIMDEHKYESVIRDDMNHCEIPWIKKLIAWRLGDPRVIRGK